MRKKHIEICVKCLKPVAYGSTDQGYCQVCFWDYLSGKDFIFDLADDKGFTSNKKLNITSPFIKTWISNVPFIEKNK